MPEIRLTYRATVANGAEVFIESNDLATFQGALYALCLASPAPAAEPPQAKPAKAPKAEKPAAPAAPVEVKPDPAPAAPEAPAARTPAEAASAVRAYGTRTSIDAAKKLLASLGMSRTSDITPERVEEVFAAIEQAGDL